MKIIKVLLLIALIASAFLWATRFYSQWQSEKLTIYPSLGVVTMSVEGDHYQAIAVARGAVLALGDLADLRKRYPNARVNQQFAKTYIYPGFIDPHIHLLLAAMQYSLPMAPPWDIELGDRTVSGVTDREAFLKRIADIDEEHSGTEPLVVYGYHELVHGELNKALLDTINPNRPLLVWHYSSHDFYLNSSAIAWAGIDAAMHHEFEGIAVDANGELTGRVYEDALPVLLGKISGLLASPRDIRRGYQEFSKLLARGGVTTAAELGYGIIGKRVEDINMLLSWGSHRRSGFRLFLVPEYRAMVSQYGNKTPEQIKRWVDGEDWSPAPVLPQVKFFSDGAFYSQTMRVGQPGYAAGQSKGTLGLWVTQPKQLFDVIQPFWQAGLGVRIHSNGDDSQDAVLNTLSKLRKIDPTQRFVIEHAGLFSPEAIGRAASLDAAISAASHYVFYLGEALQAPLAPVRHQWILPLGAHVEQGNKVALHSDAPLAPPLPLLAASIHVTRATREGSVLNPEQALSPYQAINAITLDAAYALGLENEIGSLEVDKRADFTVLNKDPLSLSAASWNTVSVVARVVNGKIFLND